MKVYRYDPRVKIDISPYGNLLVDQIVILKDGTAIVRGVWETASRHYYRGEALVRTVFKRGKVRPPYSPAAVFELPWEEWTIGVVPELIYRGKAR